MTSPMATPGSTCLGPMPMLASRLHVRRARDVDVSAGSLGKTAELALGRASNSPASCRIPAHLTSTPEARDCRTCEDRDARMTIPPLMAVQGGRGPGGAGGAGGGRPRGGCSQRTGRVPGRPGLYGTGEDGVKLLNPGPVNVTKGVRRALLRPDICHREEEFSRLLAGIRERLARVTDSRRTHAAALLTGSGTLAVEAMLATYDTRTLVLANGVYGDRLGRILAAHRVPFCKLEGPDGAFPALSSVEEALEADPRLEDIALVHHETSTGVLNPLEAVARLAKKHGKKLFVDAVSSIGSERIALKDIDFLAGSAGKCLHGYPGVSFVLVKKRWAAEGRRGGVYLDAAAAPESQEDGSVAFTPAVQLFYAFDAALKELEHEGLGTRIRRYASKSAFVRAGLKKMDLRLLAEDPAASHALP